MERERPLDADAERLLSDGKGLAHACALTLDHDPLEDLHAPALALDHLEMNAHAVARLERRQVAAQLALLEALDHAIHEKRPGGPGGNPSAPTAGADEAGSPEIAPRAQAPFRSRGRRSGSAASRS